MSNSLRTQTMAAHGSQSEPAALPPTWQTRLASGDRSLRVHLVGIGGAGLSAIARVLLEMGVQVSGSDRQMGAATTALQEAGASIFIGHAAENLDPLRLPDVLLVSSAVDAANPERKQAEAHGVPVVKRSDFLPALLGQRRVIAVAGTHGKSTTTAMTAKILRDAGIDAGYIIGANVPGLGSGSAGTSDYFVIEADEYDHMFLGLSPEVAVITSVEWDHPDCFPTPASFRRAFMQFVDRVDRNGSVISCRDDAGAEQLREFAASRGAAWVTYGLAAEADVRAESVEPVPGSGSTADVRAWNSPVGRLELQIPGLHNVRNALAAMAAAAWCEVPMQEALASLRGYRGAGRRFEVKGEAAGVTVIDDYAHHPSEIAITLAGARQRYPGRRIWAVWQPHTFSRTRELLADFAGSFGDADRVIVTDIYAAREVDDGSLNAGHVVTVSRHPAMRHIGGIAQVAQHLAQEVQPGDVVMTLGAGDGNKAGKMLLELLAQRNGTHAEGKSA
jgi:UDP-N-acetylmuramate--alanine ligase